MTANASTSLVKFKFFQLGSEKHGFQIGRQLGEEIRWFLSGERTLDELAELRNSIRSSNAAIPVALTRLISPTPQPWELATTMFFLHEQEEILELLTSLESYLQQLGERMEQWPVTVEGAVDQLLSQMPQRNKTALRNAKDDDLVMMHMSLGQWIRNRFGLWAGNEALLKSCGAGKAIHPDDASSLIIRQARERLKKLASQKQ